jgi:hypothetical protein
LPEVLKPLSENGWALSLYWDGTGKNKLKYAEKGDLVLRWDKSPYLITGAFPAEVDTTGLNFSRELDNHWIVSAFVLGERLIGARLPQDWLARQHDRYFIAEL